MLEDTGLPSRSLDVANTVTSCHVHVRLRTQETAPRPVACRGPR